LKLHNTTLARNRCGRREAGFAIVEALVAFLVIAFGMLALGAFQYTLSRSSDIAKQRTEATRIAQSEIDRLRSFAQRPADGAVDVNLTFEEDLQAGGVNLPDVTGAATNTVFRTRRVITAPTAPLPADGENFRWVNVVVRWDDRTGTEQLVSLSTAIHNGVPGDLGGLSTGRGVATTLRPKNRNINIPYPAVNLAGGLTSAFAVPPNNIVFIFDNDTGRVTGRCTVTPPVEGAALTPQSAGCASADAYLLSGYVRFKTSGPTADRNNIDLPSTDLSDPTRPLLPTVGSPGTGFTSQPMTIASGATGNAPSAYECYAQEQVSIRNPSGFEVIVALDPATGLPYPSPDPRAVPAGFPNPGNNDPKFIAYMCIVSGSNHDGDVATPNIWSGTLTLNAQGAGSRGWQVGNGGSNFKICRFTSDYNRNDQLSNGEHPQYYRQVTGTLDSQNFLVLRGGNSDPCPPDIRTDPANGNYTDTNTASHQPTPELSFRCNALTGNGNGGNSCTGNTNGTPNKQVLEPANATTTLLME
jgi:type II secretory pathway pseudopilin PulG